MGEAALIATAAVRPEVAAIAEAGPSNASSAVAAALAEDLPVAAADSADSDEDDMGPEKDEADHLRRPIVKDTTKAQRAARPRANSTKKNATKKATQKVKAKSPGKKK